MEKNSRSEARLELTKDNAADCRARSKVTSTASYPLDLYILLFTHFLHHFGLVLLVFFCFRVKMSLYRNSQQICRACLRDTKALAVGRIAAAHSRRHITSIQHRHTIAEQKRCASSVSQKAGSD